MRVVGGSAGGRRLKALPGSDVRPTSDRVREAVFAMLGSLEAVAGARVLDLFAGTGALGIEALSRGATSATFVDHSRESVAAVRANLAATGFEPCAEVVRADVVGFLAAAGRAGSRWELAFADPPYGYGDWPGLLAVLPADLAVLEDEVEVGPAPGWDVVKARRYGGSVVTLARRH